MANCLDMKGEIHICVGGTCKHTDRQQGGFISLLTGIRGTQIQISKLCHKLKKLWRTHRQMNARRQILIQTNSKVIS
jgi:hypothetical protein